MMSLRQALTLLFVMVVVWHMITIVFQLPSYILPNPWQVSLAFIQNKYIIGSEAVTTIIETVIGFITGILCGVLTGIILAYTTALKRWFLPIVITSQAIPTFALAPLLVIWFGYGMSSKIAVTVLMIFFPVTSSMVDGFNKLPADWALLANSFSQSHWHRFLKCRLPAALPTLASGIRVAAVSAPIGAIAGEWVGSSHGLGYLMLNANARMDIDLMFACILLLVSLTLLFYYCINHLLIRTIWWS